MSYTPEQYRLAWLESALELWREHITDEHQSPRIKQMFRACGWSFWVDDSDGYKNNARHAWCGIFQAFAGLRVGRHLEADHCVPVHLNPDIARVCLPSTQRVASAAKWQGIGVPAPESYAMLGMPAVEAEGVLLPGVVCTISARDYGDRRNHLGGHYVMVVNYDPATAQVETVEGNAFGTLANGDHGEGVVRNRRHLDVFRRAYHFDLRHFEAIDG